MTRRDITITLTGAQRAILADVLQERLIQFKADQEVHLAAGSQQPVNHLDQYIWRCSEVLKKLARP